MIQIIITTDKAEIDKALKIREEVFVKGQNVSKELEIDGLDDSSEHVLLYYNNKPTGTARIRYNDNKMRLERIAILDLARGKGLGIKLMEYLVKYAKEKKVKEIYMHAQYYLLDFYSKFGFKPRGDIFYEANIKHVEMYLEM